MNNLEKTPLCKDCEYFSEALVGICVAPSNGVSMVTGKPKPVFAHVSRSDNASLLLLNHDKCGTEAKHFVRKSEICKPWWKFWSNHD